MDRRDEASVAGAVSILAQDGLLQEHCVAEVAELDSSVVAGDDRLAEDDQAIERRAREAAVGPVSVCERRDVGGNLRDRDLAAEERNAAELGRRGGARRRPRARGDGRRGPLERDAPPYQGRCRKRGAGTGRGADASQDGVGLAGNADEGGDPRCGGPVGPRSRCSTASERQESRRERSEKQGCPHGS